MLQIAAATDFSVIIKNSSNTPHHTRTTVSLPSDKDAFHGTDTCRRRQNRPTLPTAPDCGRKRK
ncbi:hypothetical protein LN384_24060, partial [Enterobacter hormaechei subsp. steigerwaltii]|nr:hypothetical protein [Enterobacter hormaechei subsp. steigerwaltii]